jgi:hypothetical protein
MEKVEKKRCETNNLVQEQLCFNVALKAMLDLIFGGLVPFVAPFTSFLVQECCAEAERAQLGPVCHLCSPLRDSPALLQNKHGVTCCSLIVPGFSNLPTAADSEQAQLADVSFSHWSRLPHPSKCKPSTSIGSHCSCSYHKPADVSFSHWSRLPHPSECELYYVNRDTLFSYHKASELFLQRMMALYVASHYKNTPNDLQLMSDAPAHHLFVLLGASDLLYTLL